MRRPLPPLPCLPAPSRTTQRAHAAQGTGRTNQALSSVLGSDRSVEIDVNELETLFARPEIKLRRSTHGGDERSATSAATRRVTLLDQKRSTAIGIVMQRIKAELGQDTTLREVILDVDLNALSLDILRMVGSVKVVGCVCAEWGCGVVRKATVGCSSWLCARAGCLGAVVVCPVNWYCVECGGVSGLLVCGTLSCAVLCSVVLYFV